MRAVLSILAAVALTAAASPPAPAPPPWSPAPWLDDLAQARRAFETTYANIDWLNHDRGIAMSDLFGRAVARLGAAGSDAEARAVFDRMILRVADGHVAIDWPVAAPSAPASRNTPDLCDAMGFDARRSAPGIGQHLAGYRPVGNTSLFPAGIVIVGGRKVGVLRIGVFDPQGSPALCRAALDARHRGAGAPCDDGCRDALLTSTYDRLTAALEEQVRALKAAGAIVLLVDLTGNGGGSEWAEAAARILSPIPLTSERRGFVRGAHWAKQWQALAEGLRRAAAGASAQDRARLLAWADEADAARRDAEQACAGAGACPLVGRAGYATGLVGRAAARDFAGKPWADLVFSIAQFPYHDSVWARPLAVLVDDETWSAAEEFAAVLQDNDAATIVGSRTGGAGCGHTDGGTPTKLSHSGATLELPDCVRFRADGSNEVAGVIPDMLIGWRANDGADFKARLLEGRLPDAIAFTERKSRSSPRP